MMEGPHIVKSFDRDLNEIETLLLEIGGLVEAQLENAIKALARCDIRLANKVIAADERIDNLEQTVNEKAISLLALRQPVADDLRAIVAALKVSAALERIADYAKNIAKRTNAIEKGYRVDTPQSTINAMSKLVQEMISDVLDAFVERNLEEADDVRERDNEVDLLHNLLFRELLTYMMEDPRKITSCMHLLFVAKNLERAGDLATGIAEQVHYLITGTIPNEDRPKSDESSTTFIGTEE